MPLYTCQPTNWSWSSKPFRICLGWITMTLFSLSFLVVPISFFLLIPFVWKIAPFFCLGYIITIIASFVVPVKEWPWARTVGQLWYEILDFRCNLSEEKRKAIIKEGDEQQYIIAMHPHGIVPFQAILWAAYCDQYLSDEKTNKKLYGFGAAADVVMYLPVLRNIMGWLSAGSADYKTLKDGLAKGICGCVNAAGRIPRHLYLLPGGVAEVFTSTPGRHAIVFKSRRGLVKLSLETGASLCPTYVFGGTDFFNNLATHSGIFSRLSRSLRMGITIFWGRFGLPIPFAPRVSLCIADPIPVTKWTGDGPVPSELIDQLHAKYLNSIQNLFDTHKAEAGYPDAKLEVL